MGTEGAGGLSTEAIERCIVGWADETQDGDEIPAARAELAALRAAAGQVGPLRAALSGLLGGISVHDRPDPNQSVCRGLHTLRMVDEAMALVVADAERGRVRMSPASVAAIGRLADALRAAAAARDLPRAFCALTQLEALAREARAEVARMVADERRAGGAGDKGAADGGADGG